MSMLSIALDQIQRPTWWIECAPESRPSDAPHYKRSGPVLEERKRRIIEFMREAAEPVRVAEVAEHFCLSYQQTISTLRQLEMIEQVVKVTRGRSDVLWALAEAAQISE